MAPETAPEAASRSRLDARNKWAFSVGTLGRDMVYAMLSQFMLVYLTKGLGIQPAALLWTSGLILAARLFDAVMDIVMGSVVDNTRSRWGHYKPWIFIGALASGVATILLFSDFGLAETAFVIYFAVVYLIWGLTWTMNDIPYWSMLPALSLDQKVRERMGGLAKVFATIGLFGVVVAILPVTSALEPTFGRSGAWTAFAVGIVVIMLAGQAITLFGVKEPEITVEQEHTSLREIAGVVVKNDQLLWVVVSTVVFLTGYLATATFGSFFFIYVYRNEGLYSVFGAILGLAQIAAYVTFPLVRKRLARKTIYTISIALMVVGYVIFYFSPLEIVVIGAAALLIFFGAGWITILTIVFISDTVDYGHWKLGRRNVAVTFALQPFVSKVGAALSTQIVAIGVVASGIAAIEAGGGSGELTPAGEQALRTGMMLVPLALVVLGYLVYLWKYRIDEAFYSRIIKELGERGQLVSDS